MSQRIRGVLAPVVTPFKNDFSPDPQRLIAHRKWLLSQNCGLAVFGTNSEANSLSLEERAMLLDKLVAAGVITPLPFADNFYSDRTDAGSFRFSSFSHAVCENQVPMKIQILCKLV